MTDAGASFERRVSSPRRVRNGIRLRAEGDDEPRTWVARRWRALLDDLVPPGQRREGLEYARRGQTVSLEVRGGRVEARVQGRAAEPYAVSISVPVFGEQQWRQIIDAMSAEAFYTAKLLAQELPAEIEPLLAAIDLCLLPQSSEIAIECDCPIRGACKHAAAIGYLLAERLEGDPLDILSLRGLAPPHVLERLGAARARKTRGVAAAHAEPLMPATSGRAGPLEESLEVFWRPGSAMDGLRTVPPPHHAPHALLRRLGPSPLPGRFPLVGLLASVYDTVAEAAIRLRDRAEGID